MNILLLSTCVAVAAMAAPESAQKGRRKYEKLLDKLGKIGERRETMAETFQEQMAEALEKGRVQFNKFEERTMKLRSSMMTQLEQMEEGQKKEKFQEKMEKRLERIETRMVRAIVLR